MSFVKGDKVKHKNYPQWGIAVVIDSNPGIRNDIHVRIVDHGDIDVGMNCFWLVENLTLNEKV